MKAAPKSQREMYYDAERRSAEINKTFLEMLPTMRRRDLEKLIEKRPALWGRFAGYLTSGHVFADDPPVKAHHATKKSPAKLQREIDEALAGRGAHATMKTAEGRVLKCDMSKTCEEPVTHIDDKGFVYCTKHGIQRRGSGHRCRKLSSSELGRLRHGETLAHY